LKPTDRQPKENTGFYMSDSLIMNDSFCQRTMSVGFSFSFCCYLYYQYTQKDNQEGDLGLGLRREEYLKNAIR
jgi:hypothetical protein